MKSASQNHRVRVVESVPMMLSPKCREELRAALLRAKVKAKSWSVMAAMTGVAANDLAALGSGAREMGPDMAVKLARALGFVFEANVVPRAKAA
jgi:hypothetical protein